MKILNPSTNQVIADLKEASSKDVDAVIALARNTFDQGGWKESTLAERKRFLLKISQGILERAAELAQIETRNTGKPIKESTLMDIPAAAATFKYFAENLEKLLVPETIEISSELANAKASLLRQPLGVAVLITPWNYPLLIASWKMAQALAAGNSVILKPSSLTPLSAIELVKIIEAAGVPQGVVNILIGSGDKIGEALCSHKWVDLVSFTGSNAVGRKILGYATTNVKKVIMELGGKSAGIILEDADLETAVNGSLCSAFLNQGAMCTAMSRILVSEKIYDKFVADFVAKAGRIKLGPGEDFQSQIGPLISESHRKKVLAWIEKGKKEGAQLLCGGKIPNQPELKAGFYLEPAVFSEVTPKMSIFQEEIFGPVASIIKFSSVEEALGLANDTDYGLAASIWTKDKKYGQALAAKINAGTIWLNTYGMFYNELPYGGFKQSGFGKELGREGLLEYTRLQNTITEESVDSKPLVSYWYGF